MPFPRLLPQRLTRGVAIGVGLALVVLTTGCQGGEDPPVSLQLAISTGQGSDGVARANLKRLATQIANEYMRNHPRVLLHLRFLPEGDLVESVRSRARLGAGPDLLISRVAPVEILEREGHIKPIEISPRQLDPLQLKFLSRFRDGNTYDALPFLLQPMVACYDRRLLPKAPTQLDELPVRAAEGVRVGLPLQMSELLWTASDFDADRALLRLFRTRVQTKSLWQGLSPSERSWVEDWLTWLARANIEPNVNFVETGDELVERMERGQLHWISCNSTAIERLKRKLGPHLGVSVLPTGRDGKPARPMARLQLLSFGRDSTPAQRQVATSFALFVLNDFSQSNLIGKAFGNMPVNQNVVLPVKDSPALAAMQASLDHSTVPTFREGVGFRRSIGLRGGSQDPLTQLLKRGVYGEESPQVVTSELEALAKDVFMQDLSKGVIRYAVTAGGDQ